MSQIADNYDPTSIYFDLEGSVLVYRGLNVDEGSQWYFANLNDAFTAAAISQGAFREFGQSHSIDLGDFYMGVNTGVGNHPRSAFGWALLRNTGNSLQLLGSGMTYDQQGIYIGTMTTIPEPVSLPLLTLTAIVASSLCKRNRSHPKCDP